MKKTVLTIIIALTYHFSFAQQADILYVDYKPDLCISAIEENYVSDTINIDFDNDGSSDFKMYLAGRGHFRSPFVESSWKKKVREPDDTMIIDNGIWCFDEFPVELLFQPLTSYQEYMMGFRKELDGAYYYAWVNIYMMRKMTYSSYKIWVFIDDFAYCNKSDYLLHWGQKSTLFDVFYELYKELFEVKLHPNPTNGIVTITGKDLSSIEALNIMGQTILKSEYSGDNAIIDFTGQPVGIYVFNITNKQGNKCTKKIVKE